MKKETKKAYHFLLPNEFSSLHPACTFIHEFSHSAHKDNLSKKWSYPISIMNELRNMQVQNSIGRLITRYKLGNYSLDKRGGMNEFMAERMTQDICKKMSDYAWLFSGNYRDFDYSNIFERKWNCRYSTPQAYLDYYTQQVWNGDIREAENAAGKVERYLEEIERPNYQSETKQEGFRGFVDRLAGRVTKQANWLDERNKLTHYND